MHVLKALYQPIFLFFDGNTVLINLFGWLVFIIGWFFLLSGIFLYTDITGKPEWLLQYKVQHGQNPPMDMIKLKKALKVVVFNLVVLNLLNFYPLHLFQVWYGNRFGLEDLPGVTEIVWDIFCSFLVQEVIFYYSHRLLHYPWVYKRVHKLHHEWTAPIGMIAVYASPTEYLTGNGMSVFLGPVFMKSHIVTIWIWYVIFNIVTIVHHSGYHLPLLPSPEFHDFHHLRFQGNYGTLGILDWLHGTDYPFRDTIQKERHHNLWTFTPMSELVTVNNVKPESLKDPAKTD